MGREIVDIRALGHDPGRVHAFMAAIIVLLGLRKVQSLGNPRPLVELAGIGPEIGKLDQPVAVALEMTVIDRIEPEQGRETGASPPR